MAVLQRRWAEAAMPQERPPVAWPMEAQRLTPDQQTKPPSLCTHQRDALLQVQLQRQQLAVPCVPPRHRGMHPHHLAAGEGVESGLMRCVRH